MYEERLYRDHASTKGLVNFTCIVGETDLRITAKENLAKRAEKYIRKYRSHLKEYGRENPDFYESLIPVEACNNETEDIIKAMIYASAQAGVGPMAAVAGAMAQFVGQSLLKHTDEVIIENGGDIFLASAKKRKILVYAGKSILSEKICIEIDPLSTPLGICTSSGTVGHSLSFGKADAVVVLSKNTALADAVATATGNIVKCPDDINKGIEFAKSIEEIIGVLIIVDDKLGLWGDIKLVYP